MLTFLLFAAAALQSEARVEDKSDGKYEVQITATMDQLPIAKQRMQAAMKKTCGKARVDAHEMPLIINTNDVPMRFLIMQPFTCLPAK